MQTCAEFITRKQKKTDAKVEDKKSIAPSLPPNRRQRTKTFPSPHACWGKVGHLSAARPVSKDHLVQEFKPHTRRPKTYCLVVIAAQDCRSKKIDTAKLAEGLPMSDFGLLILLGCCFLATLPRWCYANLISKTAKITFLEHVWCDVCSRCNLEQQRKCGEIIPGNLENYIISRIFSFPFFFFFFVCANALCQRFSS